MLWVITHSNEFLEQLSSMESYDAYCKEEGFGIRGTEPWNQTSWSFNAGVAIICVILGNLNL